MTTSIPSRAAARTTLPSSNSRAYVLCQLLGWGAYTIADYLIVTIFSGRSVRAALSVLLFSIYGVIGTHLLRAYSRRHQWHTLPLSQLAPRILIAVLLVASCMVTLLITVGIFVLHVFHWSDLRWPITFTILFNISVVIFIWCAIYYNVHAARRRRAAEMEALRLALIAQSAQFETLRAQLNPHFLFNCLNSLRALIQEDPERAKQMVTQLSSLLRYTLQAGKTRTVTLQEELDAVQEYLSLEKVRFEERLRIRCEVAPATLSARVPPMLVQTLAENGLKHSISALPQGGELRISAAVNNGSLQITVCNPGSLSQDGESRGIGLQNARERLRLLYGDASSLSLTAANGEVRALVVMPMQTAETNS